MTGAAALPGLSSAGEDYAVTTPAGHVIVTFPGDEELPPVYSGDSFAIAYLHEVIGDCVGSTGAALSPQTLTPIALTEMVPAEDTGIKVTPPSDFSEPESDMQTLDSAERRVIPFPVALLDSAAPAKSVADLRAELAAANGDVIARLGIARALLSRFTGSNPDAGNDSDELAPRRATSHFYDFDDNRKPAQRKRENRAAEELLRQIDTGDVDAATLTDEQKAVLAKYSGLGGALLSADGKKGSAYEYYTPKPIAEGIWNLMAELGFTGGKVLDPSAGTGIFGATAPLSAAVDAVELSKVSGRINGLVNGGPGYTATVAPYEKVAAATPDEIYDAVVTNVPFGGVADRGGNNLLDPRYQNEPLQNYFILRTMEKLRPGGLAVFITPPRCVSGKGGKEEDLRVNVSYMAEFLGAYRLPNSVFGTAAADTVTDVIAFRKYSREVIEKIDELREQSPETLIEANVQWQPFVSGRYFVEDGKRFILGDVEVGKGQWGDVERVVTTQPVGEVAKMLRKFPESRVNWELLDATPTDPILYRDGDTITQAGQTLEFRAGQWHPLERNSAPDAAGIREHAFVTPYAAFEASATYAEASQYLTHMVRTSQSLEIPDWVRGTLSQLDKLGTDAERAKFWKAGVIGMAAQQVLQERMSEEVGVNYLEEYPDLSEAMQTFVKVAKNRPGGLTGKLRDGLGVITAHVRKDGFSEVWRGDVAMEVAALDVGKEFAYEGVLYRTKSKWVPLDEAKAIFGEDFDPITSEAWCISADGQSVARADDFYIGNVKDVLEQLDNDIENAATSEIKAKLLWQKSFAASRYEKIDVRALNYGWGTPFVELSEKLEFARRYIHDSAYIDINDDGEQAIKLDLPSSMKDTDKGKLLMRLSDYLARGTVSLASAKFQMKPGDAMKELRRQVATVNQQFNGWVRGNHRIMERMQATAHDESKLRFRQIDDESPLAIPGFMQALHGYQSAFVRKMSREFGGINGFDVGLGKTFTALGSVQYAQAIGVKSKTAFVVPNSVLSNWRKEVAKAYEDTSDCIFIGLRNKKGRDVVDSRFYDEDLQAVLTNKHRKVFMTMEAWERIKMRPETIDAFQRYMGEVDKNFAETDDNKEEEIRKSKVAAAFTALREKIGAAPYLEDMGFDSLVIDEGHGYKNSVNTVDFKSAKFLSLPDPAKRGIDMQAKAWFIRGASPLRDGILPLTATPITNSPLEIYSMLSLAAGHDRVNDMCLGVRGADDFMEVMTARENIDDVTIDGEDRQTDVFVGLNNVNVLRSAISAVASIKDASDVGAQIQLPEGEEKPTQVVLPVATFGRLREYKDAFRYAIASMSGANVDESKRPAFDAVSAHFNESMGTMSNAFNLINKMELLILDPELDQRASFYSFAKADEDKIARVVDQFNQKKRIEERPRQNPHTTDDAIVSKKIIKDKETGLQKEVLRVHVMAYMRGGENRVLIDSIQPDAQNEFEALAEKAGVELDVSLPPKLAAMLKNVTKEAATPRGIDDEGNYSPIVKQIIFCDRLGLHNKIKRLLVKHAGIPASKIAVVTGQTNNEPDQILAVQDGFNAHGADNKYQIILANEKAEVGINLQKGTQAIHHLTIGWTPDSLTQRNGRGVRQGNKTGVVNVYYYDAEGTFDTYRRGMVNKKSEWIESVLDSEGGNSVNVAGGLSDKQYEALINSLGDNDAMSRIQREIDAAEEAERVTRARSNQIINAETLVKNNRLAQKLSDPANYIKEKLLSLFVMREDVKKLWDRVNAKGASGTARAKNRARIDEIEVVANGLERDIEAACTITGGWPNKQVTVADLFARVIGSYKKRGQSYTDMLSEQLRSYRIEVIDGSDLHQEWQSEVDMAKSMAREAEENFVRQSKQAGSYSEAVGRAIAAGAGWVWDGKIFTVGSFVRDVRGEGNLMLVISDSKVINYSRNGFGALAYIEEAAAGTPILPGSEGYDACITDAAAIEDIIATSGSTEKPFSSVVPEVSQRRKVIGNASYDVRQYRLPAPHFPFVLTTADAMGSPLKKRIFDEQAAIVRNARYGYPPMFVVAEDQPVVSGPWNDGDLSRGLIDYATANQLTLTSADLGYYWTEALGREISARVPYAEFRASLKGDGELEIRSNAAQFVRSRLPWFEWSSDPLALIPTAMKDAIIEAVRAITPAPIAAAATIAPVARPSTTVDNDIVAITGDTRKWKDRIKAAAVSHGNGRFRWDGTALVWNVYRSTWTRLVANYPDAAQDLSLTKPTITKF